MIRVLPILLILLLLGCGPNYRKRALGAWMVDTTSISGGDASALAKRLQGTQFRFNEDGTLSILGDGAGGAARWLVDGNKILLSAPMPEQQATLPQMVFNKEATRIQVSAPGNAFKFDLVRANKK